MTSVAHEDIRAICSHITGVCKRLGDEWHALADNMNADPSLRLQAALKGAQLHSTANAIQAVVDGHCSMAVRVVNAEAKLDAVAKLVKNRETIDAWDLIGNFEKLIHYSALIVDLKAILART